MRIDDDLKVRLVKIQEETGCSVSEIARQCLFSFVKYYEENGCVVLPVEVLPEKDVRELRLAAKKAGKK